MTPTSPTDFELKVKGGGKPDHLNAAAFTHLSLSDDERVRQIKSPSWLGYPRAKEIHAKLLDCLNYPANSRMPSALVCGEANAGKSRLLERFVEQHNKVSGDEPSLPILFIQAPPEPDLREFYGECLQKLHAPHRPKERPDTLRRQLSIILKNLGTRMLIVDEIHHLTAGSHLKQRAFLNTLKFLSNDLRISIITAGTRNALNALQFDSQIGSRFPPLKLPLWKEGTDYRRLLANFEYTTPLKFASDLAGDRLAAKLLVMSEGLLGGLVQIVREAAEKAIRSGHERIDEDVLNSINWVPLSQRRDDANTAFY